MAVTKYGDPNTATGKAFVKQQVVTTATVMALPVVTEAEIKSAKSMINTHRLSGKQKGAMVIVEKPDQSLHIAVADGPLPTDVWNLAHLDTDVTPGN